MSETTRRVSVTIPTAAAASDVFTDIATLVRDHTGYEVENVGVHAFDLDEDDDTETCVQLVVDPSGIAKAYVDDFVRAEEHALDIGAVVVELPVAADCRGEATT